MVSEANWYQRKGDWGAFLETQLGEDLSRQVEEWTVHGNSCSKGGEAGGPWSGRGMNLANGWVEGLCNCIGHLVMDGDAVVWYKDSPVCCPLCCECVQCRWVRQDLVSGRVSLEDVVRKHEERFAIDLYDSDSWSEEAIRSLFPRGPTRLPWYKGGFAAWVFGMGVSKDALALAEELGDQYEDLQFAKLSGEVVGGLNTREYRLLLKKEGER
jgi:hypothetical protein